MSYLFTSQRLGFRPWTTDDLDNMAVINADPEVMRYFPKTYDVKGTRDFIERMHTEFSNNGFCYFATEILETQELIGFIGLFEQSFEAEFNPCVDIGWRLSKKEWGKGYATEGAKACLDFGFTTMELSIIMAICPVINVPSENVMKKIGMEKQLTFKHPNLQGYPRIEDCFMYSIDKQSWVAMQTN